MKCCFSSTFPHSRSPSSSWQRKSKKKLPKMQFCCTPTVVFFIAIFFIFNFCFSWRNKFLRSNLVSERANFSGKLFRQISIIMTRSGTAILSWRFQMGIMVALIIWHKGNNLPKSFPTKISKEEEEMVLQSAGNMFGFVGLYFLRYFSLHLNWWVFYHLVLCW